MNAQDLRCISIVENNAEGFIWWEILNESQPMPRYARTAVKSNVFVSLRICQACDLFTPFCKVNTIYLYFNRY